MARSNVSALRILIAFTSARAARRRALLLSVRWLSLLVLTAGAFLIGSVIGGLGEGSATVPVLAPTAQPVRWTPPPVSAGRAAVPPRSDPTAPR